MSSQRLQKLTPFLVMDVLERAQELSRSGVDIVHLEVGEPDFDAPPCVREAMMRALNEGATHYTHSLGDLRLREAICSWYDRTYGVGITPDRVLVTSGTSPGMLLAFSVLVSRGSEVIMADPHYACYPNFVRYLDGVPVSVPVRESEGFDLSIEAVKNAMTDRTSAIIVNSPSNPTGTLLSAATMCDIGALDVPVVSDEIYHGLVYEGREHSMLEFTDDTFVLNGFSKLFAMTGFRLGYLIAPPRYIRDLQVLQQNFFISANSLVQEAGISVLEEAGDDIARMRRVYDERRRYMIDRLRQMGFAITTEPTGAFYVFVDASRLSADSYALAFDILEKAHVGVTPGIDFGEGGEGFLRFSYANSHENIAEGLDRLERYIGERLAQS